MLTPTQARARRRTDGPRRAHGRTEAGARTDVHLAGITWGKGFEWETTLFDVTPLSYAQFGLLPQVHRTERDIYHNLKLMLGAAKRIIPPLENIPNRYVVPKAKE